MIGETLLNLFLSWFPMLLLIGLWVFFMHKYSGLFSKSGMTGSRYMEEMYKETRRHNEQLERLLTDTNERLALIERLLTEKRN
ncbi:MAG: hypothetical protein ACREC6_14710 [Hyphomicrobiaceae bacterium]